MNQKALIVESNASSQNILEGVFNTLGVDCHTFTHGIDALENSDNDYTFIIVGRTLCDISGEIFLHKYKLFYGLDTALTIILTTEALKHDILEANKAGFKILFKRKDLQFLRKFISSVLNIRTLCLNANVLLIEDSKSTASELKFVLSENSSIVDHIEYVKDLDVALSKKKYELIITDYYLNGAETGDDVLLFVRNSDDKEISSIPIIMISAEQDEDKRTSFLRNGASDYIIKPYNVDELLVRCSNMISNYRLIKEFSQQQKKLSRQALTDQLTGLYNRHTLFDLAPKYISEAQRQDKGLSLLVLDLDNFKNINDKYGHAVGDEVLNSVAAILQVCCRAEDIVARFGGEEFVMVLVNINSDDALIKAEEIRELVQNSNKNDINITVSIGVTMCSDKDDFPSLFERADKAVYEAKAAGRNKVVTNFELYSKA